MSMMNNTMFGDGIVINNRTAIINNIKYPFLSNMKGNNVSVINNKAYIDGYELINGKWKRTLKAVFNMLF